MAGYLPHLELFLKVIEAGSISGAADQVGTAKSAVSSRIAQLETSVGVRLLTRSKKGVVPTAAGERMKAHALRLLTSADEALEDVRRDEQDASGPLRISLPAGIADDLLVPVISDFLRRHPKVRLDIVATDSLLDLRQASIDLALRFGWVQTGDFVARRLASFNEVLVASPAYLQQHPRIAGVADLASHHWIGYAGFGGTTQKLQIRDLNGTTREVTIYCRLRTSNAPSQKAWALAALGITRLPQFLVARELKCGELRRVLPKFTLDGPSLYAVYLADRYRPAAARALLSFLETRIRA